MQIRQANTEDAESIKQVYLQAFDVAEAELVSDLAVNLLRENQAEKILSYVAIEDNKIVGNISFSPVCYKSTNEHFAYILAPLAVAPEYQKNKIGSSLIQHGLDVISAMGSFVIFVYGDPRYYSRFGFKTELGKKFIPPYTLEYPEGWHALLLNSADILQGGTISCVESLNNEKLW